METRISVITATYNNLGNLRKTIESVVCQKYDNIEYIICDDCSNDFPIDAVNHIFENSYQNICFRLLINKKNLGTVANLTNAYKAATGEIIVNLSSGDIFTENNTLQKIATRFNEKKCDVLVTSRIMYDSKGEIQYFLPHYQERKIIEKKNTFEFYKSLILGEFRDAASGSAMCYKKSILEKYDYFQQKYKLWEDGPFLARFCVDNKVEKAYDIVSTWYEKGGVSTSGRKNMNRLLVEDIRLYNESDRKIHIEKLNFWEKRKLNYEIKFFELTDRKDLFVLCLKYIPETIRTLMISKQRKRFAKNDKKKYIDDWINNNNIDRI